jgi:hypothetical protein
MNSITVMILEKGGNKRHAIARSQEMGEEMVVA